METRNQRQITVVQKTILQHNIDTAQSTVSSNTKKQRIRNLLLTVSVIGDSGSEPILIGVTEEFAESYRIKNQNIL